MHRQEAQDLWLLSVEAEGRSQHTIEGSKGHLVHFNRWLEGQGIGEIGELTPFHLRRFLAEYAKDRSPHTVRGVYGNIRTWLRWLVAEGVLKTSPTDKVKAPTAPHSRQTRMYIRARTLLLAESAPSATAIAEVPGVHVQTVRETLRRFAIDGLPGAKPKSRPGRPKLFDEMATNALVALLHERPTEHGHADARWTLGTIVCTLARQLKVNAVSTATIRRLLKQSRHSWQRAKEWIESPDPRYAFKKSGVTACWPG
ncbi:MAG: helix-turn-helix domain-containing protein [Chloroflexi bacterium]|nr:helix-turn-helix domain-containing protein [Chloroflexota bacterium]